MLPSRQLHRFDSGLAVPMVLLALVWNGCTGNSDSRRVRPRQLRDVPVHRLAYSFRADTEVPPGLNQEDANAKLQSIELDFDARRKDDALLRTVTSPDGQRALALYGTIDEPGPTFHIDLYAADGKFLRNLTPPDLAGVFADSVTWSSDGGQIAFVGRRSLKPQPSPTPLLELPELPAASPLPSALPFPSVAPAFGLVPLFSTEQIYLCNRDGFDLRALTIREGLIYFAVSWAPDNHALAALACNESEWAAREKEFKTPAGRPRIITLDGRERLLDDTLAEAPPVWSPDSSKVATAFEVEVGIYDAASQAPTQARINLREPLLAASAAFDEKSAATKMSAATPTQPPAGTLPGSFNPIVRLEWSTPEKLYLHTAYIRLYNDPVNTWPRWHLLTLSAQAAELDRR